VLVSLAAVSGAAVRADAICGRVLTAPLSRQTGTLIQDTGAKDRDSGPMTIPQELDASRQFDDANPPSHWEPPASGQSNASWSSLLPLDGGNIYVSHSVARR
jgi:hypothetical protein